MAATKRILVIDDDPDTRVVFAAILTYAGYRVRAAADGREGTSCALAWLPDLVITDVDMPVMDGFAAALVLRRDARTARVPILVVTGGSFSSAQRVLADALFDACYLKPIVPSRLLVEVQKWIGRADGAAAEGPIAAPQIAPPAL